LYPKRFSCGTRDEIPRLANAKRKKLKLKLETEYDPSK
jgi:hypothetical protein